ncbi:hypothetical protein [Chengkuizengella axinellae]|uniref:Uncharacterized protein n=1 Tax=Chengkuizengella axinellae TaxID=3064388 RepID=A0ABT9J545_9BACL|nr:hypothetical protein [Chengkuizengella sp. 2205SS18-9]MDP5276746.1 hypothetical protein [Chengkuizengella sp. 2205SS18-9]
MKITITKEVLLQEAKKVLQFLFKLPEINIILIKEVQIQSIKDESSIRKAIDKCFHDIYSDIDIEIKMNLHPKEFHSNQPIYADYLGRIGFNNDILGISHYCTEERGEVIRICKRNGVRFDLIISAYCVDGIPLLPHNRISEDSKKVDGFWFTAVQALGKLMRKDYLIASHLSHALTQEGLVLQMILRDQEYNTNYHRYGYAEELNYLTVLNNEDILFDKTSDRTFNYIARLIYSAVKSYDILYSSLNPSYQSRLENFINIWFFYKESLK